MKKSPKVTTVHYITNQPGSGSVKPLYGGDVQCYKRKVRKKNKNTILGPPKSINVVLLNPGFMERSTMLLMSKNINYFYGFFQ